MRRPSANSYLIKMRRVTVAPVLVFAVMAAMMAGSTATLAGTPSAGASAVQSPQIAAQVVQSPVTVFPTPGTTTVSPKSQLSFRAPGLTSIPDLTVVGSQSGRHSGHWLAHSDQGGASFVPDKPFTPGETVKVNTSRRVNGVIGGALTYQIDRLAPDSLSSPPKPVGPPDFAGSPAAAPAAGSPAVTQQAPQQAAWTQPTTPTGAAGPYHSRPDLHPPLINTTVGSGVAPGLLFAGDASIGGSGAQSGAIIYDNSGQPVWFNPTTTGLLTDLRPVTYRGQSALAYFQPTTTPYPPDTNGVEIVLDNAYRQIGTIQAGNGYSINQHDVKISPDGKSALFNVWNPVPFDLSKYCSGSPPSCGPKNGIVLEAVVQQVDLFSGAVTFEWHSFSQPNPDFPLTDSYIPVNSGVTPQAGYDYIHLNSASYDTDGNFLVTGRHVSAVWKLNSSTGAVMWRMGGKRNQFTFTDGDGGPSWSHDVQPRGITGSDETISVYDNGNGRPSPQYSRGVAWVLNPTTHTASVSVQWRHSPDIFGAFVGSDRQLSNGDQLISWGPSGTTTEYSSPDPNPQPDFESQLSNGYFTYRTERGVWHATPARPPDMATSVSGTTVTAWASWNGATDVASWQLWGGPDAQHLRQLGSAPRSGFETTLTGTVLPTDTTFQVRPFDAQGHEISPAPNPDPIQAKYQSLGGSASFLGSPVGAEKSVAGGLEQDFADGSIYWSSSSGAHEVHGLILGEYKKLGGPTSVLSFPITDESPTPDGKGRFNHFIGPPDWGGSIYWTSSTGAHEVHGAIRAKWARMGWERSVLGYPVTDETGTPDGIGRFNHFSGPPGWGGSIYWTPGTGAHEVHGAIRAKWASMGWERSCLGYPVSDEFAISGGRQSNFQKGFITWNASAGVASSSC